MSFICKACGRQRAGSPAKGQEVCDECRNTQMGKATLLFPHISWLEGHTIDLLDAILDDAQNPPPDGKGDGSISEQRWAQLRAVVTAARAYNGARIAYNNAFLARDVERADGAGPGLFARARADERETAAAFLMLRGEQYGADCPQHYSLPDEATAILSGAHIAARDRGELDAMLVRVRVRGMAGKKGT